MIVRFDDFELDTEQCRLSRGGEPLRLARQPLDLLILLAKRHGELVKREDIASALWGDSTFVDAEHGINAAIKKIRAVLGDDSSDPRYIETVVRRGYRFKAAVATPEPPLQNTPPAAPWYRSHRTGFAAALFAIAVLSFGAISAAHALSSAGPRLRWSPLTRTARIHTNLPLASDGKRVYWTDYNERGCHPMSVPLEGGDPTTIVRTPFDNAFVLDAAADGHLLLNVRDNCKNLDISGSLWDLDAYAGSARKLGEAKGQSGAFSPDGTRIVYGNGAELWTVRRNGSNPRMIARMRGLVYFGSSVLRLLSRELP
ncbi:MAG: winged helix-turn-helix domain-containing protein [Acidobacteriota bacterium]|nr:winged helix-turn-helix domain-containing protein [Acidobacteriota bacterium]